MSLLEDTARAVVEGFAARGLTLGTAESLTGGMIASTVAGISGASAVLMGGVVSYDPRVKHEVLGVSQQTIDGPGVVSEACALQMTEGARRLLKTDVAVSATGVAGPTGGTAQNPVGTVWLGVSHEGGAVARRYTFKGDRQRVREQSVLQALQLALEAATEHR